MKKIFLLIFVTFFFSCKEESKKENNPIIQEIKTEQKIEPKLNEKKLYQKTDLDLDNLDLIFDQGFDFDDDIFIEKIGLKEVQKDIYNIFFLLGKESNLKKIEELKLGLIFYPSDLSLLVTEKEKKQGCIKTGVSTKIKSNGDKLFLMHSKIKLSPKAFKTLRFYFYDKQNKITGENLILNNILIK